MRRPSYEVLEHTADVGLRVWDQRSDLAASPRAVAVKAVTYHQFSLRDIPEGWEATVYFDI